MWRLLLPPFRARFRSNQPYVDTHVRTLFGKPISARCAQPMEYLPKSHCVCPHPQEVVSPGRLLTRRCTPLPVSNNPPYMYCVSSPHYTSRSLVDVPAPSSLPLYAGCSVPRMQCSYPRQRTPEEPPSGVVRNCQEGVAGAHIYCIRFHAAGALDHVDRQSLARSSLAPAIVVSSTRIFVSRTIIHGCLQIVLHGVVTGVC